MFKKKRAQWGGMILAGVLVLQASAGAFASSPEAQIGDTTYNLLSDALEAVQDGQTIEVLQDVNNEELVLFCDCESAFSITIDFNEHTVSESTANSPAFSYVGGDGTVSPTVKMRDGTLHSTSSMEKSPYGSGIWAEGLSQSCRPVLILDHMVISSQNDAGINAIHAQLQIGSASINACDDAIYAQDTPVYILAGSFYTTQGTDAGKDGTLVSNGTGSFTMTASDAIIRPENWKAAKSTLVQIIHFEDITQSNWFYDAVYSMTKKNIISGTGCWTFEPYSSITRAEFVTLLAKASGQDVNAHYGNNSFSDVSSDSWYNHYVGWAVDNGLVSGYGYGAFAPEEPVTREQIAVILLKYQTVIMKKAVSDRVTPADYTDADEISDWAQDAVNAMNREGIISGVGQDDGSVQMQPQADSTRAEACMMLYKLLAI